MSNISAPTSVTTTVPATTNWFGSVQKAIYGGISGGVAAIVGTGSVSVVLPPGTANPTLTHYVALFAVGFIAGFATVYFAPQNKVLVTDPNKS